MPNRGGCLLVLLALLLAAPAAAAAGPAGGDGMVRRMQACTPCHGAQGQATPHGYFPRIAGKPAGYLFNQLLNFRDGRRHNATMVHLVQFLSDDYLREIAEYVAAQVLPYPPPAITRIEPRHQARGEALALRGDPARGLPACTACHGAALTGALPALPGLLGLPRDYLAGQLGAWTSGQRRAAAPDCMGEVARRLGSEDVAAVSAWLAAQPVPGGGRPAAGPPAALPMRCGSGGH